MKYYTEEEVVSLLVKMGLDQHAIGHEDGVAAVCDMLSEASEFVEVVEGTETDPQAPAMVLARGLQGALRLVASSAPAILCSCPNCVGEPPEETIQAWTAMARDFLTKFPAGQSAAGDA